MPSLFKKPAPPVVVDLDEEPIRPNAKGRATPTRKEAEAARRGTPTRRGSTRPGNGQAGRSKSRQAGDA